MSQIASKWTAKDSYSAEVRTELHVDGRILRPSHTASDYLIFREPQSIPPCIARLVISIDGAPQESTLRILPQPLPSDRILVEIVKRATYPATTSAPGV
jgi:hypothetical protein